MAFDIKSAIAAAKGKGPDMTKGEQGGGFEKPAIGFTRARFVGYFELGKKESMYKGVKKVNNAAELVFELSGPKHAPRETDNGKVPHRVTVNVNLSLNEKANFFKLFKALNWEGKASHIAELLGQDYIGEIEHRESEIDGNKFTFVNLVNIRKPFSTNPETGDEYRIAVDQPLTPLKLFLWDFATPEMWDAIFIEGQYEARTDDKGKEISPAKSKNVIQAKIMKALNWKASPIHDYAMGKVTKEDSADLDAAIGDAEDASPAGADALDGIA